MKERVAQVLAQRVKNGETIGLGSGTTAELALQEIGKRIKSESIVVSGIPTSVRTSLLAEEAGIRVISSTSRTHLDWAFDGADEVDPQGNLLKGNGAAMLSEKIVAKRAKSLVIIVTEEKLVQNLGSKFAVPIEFLPEAISLVEEGLQQLGATEMTLRKATEKYGPVVTEHNNLIFDVRFKSLTPDFETRIKSIVGVVESGLFIGYPHELLIAKKDGVYSRTLQNGSIRESKL